MKQQLRFLMLTLLCAVAGIAWAEETAYKTLTFSTDTNLSSVSDYTSTWSAKVGDFQWDLVNFNNNKSGWNYVKCGRKNNASVATITTNRSIDKAITKVVVTIDAITAGKVNSTKLEVASDKDFSSNVQTVTINPTAAGDITYTVPTPTANQFYRLTYDCASGTSNGLVTISKVEYFFNDNTPQKTDIAQINSILPASLTVGNEGTFTLGATYENNAYTISWESLTPELLSFNGATYQALSVGTAEVKVTVTPENTTDYNAVTATFDVTINPAPKTFPWSEDFSSNSLAGYTVVGNGTIIYNTTNDHYAGGEVPELLIAPNGGSLSVTIDLDGHYGDMALSFKSNKNNAIVVTKDGESIKDETISTNNPYVYTYLFSVAKGTNTITLKFENTTSSNARFDDFELKLANNKKDPELSFKVTSFTAYVNSDFDEPELSNPHDLEGIYYETSDDEIAYFEDEASDVYIGVKEGTVTITAIFKGNEEYNAGSASYTIDVSKAPQGLTVNHAPTSMRVGDELELDWSSSSGNSINIDSSDPTVIELDENVEGLIHAVGAGTATITMSLDETEYYKAEEVSFTVTVIDPENSYVKVTNPNQLKAGNTYIIVAEKSDGGSYAMGTQSGKYRKAEPVVVANNEAYTDDAQELTLGGIAGMWTLTAENGMLCLVNLPTSGGIIENADAQTTDMQKSWRINEENFTVSNRENPYWVIQMNYQDGDPRFACYRNTGNLTSAYLYVKDPYTTDDEFHADPLFSINNIIVEMGDNNRQLGVNTPSDGKNNISFTFDDNSIAEIVNNGDGTYTVTPLAVGETTVKASLPRTDSYELANYTFTIKVVGQFNELASDVYQKVTSTADLTSGKYLIVYEEGSLVFDGNRETLDAANNNKEVTITDGKIYCPGSYFMIEKGDNGKFTIQSQSGFYIGQTTNANGLATSNTNSYANTISIDGSSNANAVIVSSGGAYLRYNAASSDNRFRYYKSSTYTQQKAIQLYKSIVENKFEFDISERATDGTDHYATIADLGMGYFKVSGGVDVYTVVVDGDKLSFPIHFSDGDAIPGNGAYLVKGTPGHYGFPATVRPDEEVKLGENMLHSTGDGSSTGEYSLTAKEMAAAGPEGPFDDGTKFYKLSLYKGKVGFFYGDPNGSAFNYTKPHQAYLALEPAKIAEPGGDSGSQNISGFYFDGTTAIREVLSESSTDNATYTLSGIRVDGKNLPKGIYIVNGKKVVIK